MNESVYVLVAVNVCGKTICWNSDSGVSELNSGRLAVCSTAPATLPPAFDATPRFGSSDELIPAGSGWVGSGSGAATLGEMYTCVASGTAAVNTFRPK